MPGGDRTGPMGMGPMTGRAAGYCGGSATPGYNDRTGGPGYANPLPGRGFGLGFGRGFGARGRGFGGGGYGRRNMYHATGLPGWMRFGAYAAAYGYPEACGKADPEAERQALSAQAEYLQKELDSIRRRLDEIGKRDA